MRLLRGVLIAGALLAAPVFAQEHGAEAPKSGEGAAQSKESHEPDLSIWKWANFLILAAGLGYLAGKNAGPFFASRSGQIRKDMVEAAELRKEAEERASHVEQRLANLETEIAALRAGAQQEAQAEGARVAQQAAAEMAKIQTQAEQEIASAAKAARTELRRYSAELAVGLAERKIRDRMTPAAQNTLVDRFVHDLEGPSSKAQAT